jgi:molybdate transport system substrate-binding protein
MHRAHGASRAARCCSAALAVAWLAPAAAQRVEPLQALSSNGVRAALEELVPACERTLGRSVAIEYGTSASIRQRVTGGENLDVVFVTTEVVDELARAGHLATGSVTPLGSAGIGVGIRAGARRFDLAPGAIAGSLLAASSVTYAADGASRPHIERMFERLGIAGEMKAKTLLEQGSVRAAAKVVNGEAEILLTLVSEILPVAGMELLGPLPAEYQGYVSFAAALGAHAADPAAARAFIACVVAPSAGATFASKGITMGARR